MTTETLTSLAMLKVNIDHGKDYLDYLKPYITQILYEDRPDPVTSAFVCQKLVKQFGLDIPDRTVEILLRRISRTLPIRKENGAYHIIGEIKNPGIYVKKAAASRHIKAVILGLLEFSQKTVKPLLSEDEAIVAVCTFLSRFNIPCLRAYLRGTVIPEVELDGDSSISLVSQYIIYLQKTSPERFESLMILVQGHMLANSLLCPDLQNAPKTFKGVSFFFDSPLVVCALGIDGEHRKTAMICLIELLRKLGADVFIFSHTRDELVRVITSSAEMEDPSRFNSIAIESRRSGRTKSDLILMAREIDEHLKSLKIDVFETPGYVEKYQIDEIIFEKMLCNEIKYSNPKARECDINSIRCIYTLRKGHTSSFVEKSKVIFVTKNNGITKAASYYSEKFGDISHVPAAIMDFALVNMAWLKAPMGANNLPVAEVLAFSYAALQPTKEFLCKYLAEIDKLEKDGKVSEVEHQILRSTFLVQDELMLTTLGDVNAFSQEELTETLEKVVKEIKGQEIEKLDQEKESHNYTKEQLAEEKNKLYKIKSKKWWEADLQSKIESWVAFILVTVIIITGMVVGSLQFENEIIRGFLLLCWIMSIAYFIVDAIFGFPLAEFRKKLEKLLVKFHYRRKLKSLGIDYDAELNDTIEV